MRILPLVFLLALCALPGCSDDSAHSAADLALSPGTEGGPCYGNGTCNSGLTCAADRCVPEKDAGQVDAPASDEGPSRDEGLPAGDTLSMDDLTATAGDPCLDGKCAEGLVCLEDHCYRLCSTGCGQPAPECPPEVGCHKDSSYDVSICVQGTAGLLEACDNDTTCKAGLVCVKTAKGTWCLALCDDGKCPDNQLCLETNMGCNICNAL